MLKIFISYRRTDQPIVRVMYDRLVKIFGDGNIFWDVESFFGGKDFRDEIERVLNSCNIALAMISGNWAGYQPETNSYRITGDGDFVRIEIESLLRRQDKSIPEQERVPLIPVLINSMTMEQLPDLPESIAQFRYLNASAIHPEPHFISDLEILIRRIIKQYAAPAEQEALLRKTDVVFEHVAAASAQVSSDQQRAAEEAAAEAKLARARMDKIKADEELASWQVEQDRKQAIIDQQQRDEAARLARENETRERQLELAALKAQKEEAKSNLKVKHEAIDHQQNRTLVFALPIYGLLYAAIPGYLAFLIWNYPFKQFGGHVFEYIMIGIFGVVGLISGLIIGLFASWGFNVSGVKAIAAAAIIVIGTVASTLYGESLYATTGLLLGLLAGLLITAFISAMFGASAGGYGGQYAIRSPWYIHGDAHYVLSDQELQLAKEVQEDNRKEREAKSAAR